MSSLTAMQVANHVQRVLSSGAVSFGAWQMLPGHHLSRAIARSGVDWVTVDTEHGAFSDASMHEAVPAIAACGVSPLIRIAAAKNYLVKRALDSGAHGVIVPLVNTAEEARSIVAAAKFPPVGLRGFGSPFPMGAFGIETASEYLNQANGSILTIVQIETREALENVNAIAAVDGIDVLFVGPFDLGNSIGHPVTEAGMHTALKDAIEKIRVAADKAGKVAGMYATSGEQARMFAQQGFRMVCVAADAAAIPAFVSTSLAAAKGDGQEQKMSGPYGR